MKNSKVGIRYSRALFDLCHEQGILDKAYADMGLVDRTLVQSRELRHLMASPVVKPGKKEAIFREIFGKEIHTLVMSFFVILFKKRREEHIQAIAEEFVELYREHEGIHAVYLRTASPLDLETRKRIIALVHRQTGGVVELIEELDPKLIGGFILKFGDSQYDASILHELNKLKQQFSENIYVKGF